MRRSAIVSTSVVICLSALAGLRAAEKKPLTATKTKADAIQGTWELTCLIEDGQLITRDAIEKTLIRDARLWIEDQFAAFHRPDGSPRRIAFVTDSTANPKSVDLAGTDAIGGKGIYTVDKKTLIICIGQDDTTRRPSEFTSRSDKQTVLMILHRVADGEVPSAVNQTSARRTSKSARTIAERVATHEEPSNVELPSDEDVLEMLVGTWGHQTDTLIQKVTFNGDGSFASLITFKKGLKKLFDQEERSSGTWHVEDGVVVLSMSASTNPARIGQVYSFKLESISGSEATYTDVQSGERRIEWKVQ